MQVPLAPPLSSLCDDGSIDDRTAREDDASSDNDSVSDDDFWNCDFDGDVFDEMSDDDDDGGRDSCASSPLIEDLRGALNTLISMRRKRIQSGEGVDNDDDGQTLPSNVSNSGDDDDVKQRLRSIPNLVNRAMLERRHCSQNRSDDEGDHGATLDDCENDERQRRTDAERSNEIAGLLVRIVVLFAEPHFANVACPELGLRRRQRRTLLGGRGNVTDGAAAVAELAVATAASPCRKRSRCEAQGEDGDEKVSHDPETGTETTGAAVAMAADDEYDERAVAWATDRLRDLLRHDRQQCRRRISNDGSVRVRKERGRTPTIANNISSSIPELDALLSATGSKDGDGLEHERTLQRALMSSVRTRLAADG